MTPRPSPHVRLFLREFAAVFLWVVALLSTYITTATPLLHTITPSLGAFPPLHVFLAALVATMAIWEALGLSLGSPFNPSVTLSLAIAGDLTPSHALVMVPAQFLAHIVAVLALRTVSHLTLSDANPHAAFHPPQPHEQVSYGLAVTIEAGITALLCVVALSLKHLLPSSATFKKWSVMTLLIVAVLTVTGEWTGSCMNPAMHFALALLEGHWKAHSVYWIGPLLGSLVAGCAHNWLFKRRSAPISERVRRSITKDMSDRIKTD